jgi:hypothetical protein
MTARQHDPFGGGGATVEQARARLHRRVMRGDKVDCPCCGQRAAVYRRRINGTMAFQLGRLADHGGWMHARDIELGVTSADRDFQKMRFWGLVECDGGPLWRITARGRDFVGGRTTVPAVAFVYDNEPVGFSAERVRFDDCLGEPFDLLDVLGGGEAESP